MSPAGSSKDELFPIANSGNGTGSLVGYDPAAGNVMETGRVHGGMKSMPFEYNSTAAPTSEAVGTFGTAQDWTRAGITTLVLYLYGDPANTAGQVYVKVNGTRIDCTAAAAGLTVAGWTQCNVDLAGLTASSLRSVQTLTIGISGGAGKLLFDDIRLYRVAP